jgi:hypothetical protein
MPKGMVCCDTGYCLSGQVCTAEGTCSYRSSSSGGGSSGGSDDDDDDDDDDLKFTYTRESATLTLDSPSFTAPSIEPIPTLDDDGKFPTYTSGPLPTGPRAGGDDDGDSSSNSNSGDGGNSGSILLPSFFMGLVAIFPLLL